MTGMDAATGRALPGLAHLAQSIADILSTPIGTRVARRDYGSQLSDLVDAPNTGLTKLRLFAAVAVAIARWEKRVTITRVALAGTIADLFAGRATLILDADLVDAPRRDNAVRLSILLPSLV